VRFLTVPALACLVLGTSAAAASQTPDQTPLTLEAALSRAMSLNPAIVAARARRQADLAGVAVARERLNPEARVELERETPRQSYGLSLPWETGGKRARRIAVSEAVVQTGEAEVARTEIEVRLAVRRAYSARLVAEARLALLDELRGIATRARTAAEQRFQAGSAPRLEVLQAQLALAQAENEMLAVRGSAAAARAELNALLAFPLEAPTTLASTLDTGLVTPLPDSLTRAVNANSELLVFDRRIAEQRARIALARAMQMPDVTPEVQVTRDAEPEFSTGWRAAVGVTLPIFTTHRAGVVLEEAALAQLEREREAAAARIAGEVASALAVAEAQRQLYVRYRDEILPQALEIERIAEDAYRLGQTGIAALLQALQATRTARLQSLQAAADLQSALAELERATGTPLP
jgi:cobalt-zinc-cadmium efflux system outer membrane protein